MESVSVLFLHVPKLSNYYRPITEFIWINFLPMGLLGLADSLHRGGMSTEGVHLGVEWVEDPHFSILDYIRQKNPLIVAVDLHWHHQSFDVMEWVKKIKTTFPHLFVLLGGFTASFFHEEIMKNFDAVDGIIRITIVPSTPVHTTPDNAMLQLFYFPIIPPVEIVEYDRSDRCRMGVVPASS